MLIDRKQMSFYLQNKSWADPYLSHREPQRRMEIGGSQPWGIPQNEFDIDGMAILWIIRMRCRNQYDI